MPEKLFFILLLVVACGGQTHPPAAKVSPTPKAVVGIPNTDDIESVVRKLVASGAGKKGEFETTAQFEARRNALIPDREYAFAIDRAINCEFDYDADTATMKASIDLLPYLLEVASRHSTLLTVTVKAVPRRTTTQVGTNSFGARGVFTSRLYDDFGVVISRSFFAWLRSFSDSPAFVPISGLTVESQEDYESSRSYWLTFPFPLEPARAKVLKPNLRVVLVGTVLDMQVYRNDTFSPATINDPMEVTVKRSFLSLAVSEVRIVDSRTGQTVANFTQGAAKQ